MGHRAEGFQLDLAFRQRILIGVDRAKHCYLQFQVVLSKWSRDRNWKLPRSPDTNFISNIS